MIREFMVKLFAPSQSKERVDAVCLGRAGDIRVQLDAPFLIRNVGAAGSGRTAFLTEIARQSILKGWGVVYVDAQDDQGVFTDLQEVAAQIGRREQVESMSAASRDIASVAMADINECRRLAIQRAFDSAGTLYFGLPSRPLNGARAEIVCMASALFSDLLAFAERRVLLPERSRPVVILLDGCASVMKGVSHELERMIRLAKKANISLVLSDREPIFDREELDPQVSCDVYHRLVRPDMLRPQVLSTLSASGVALQELRGLDVGAAVVVIAANETRGQVVLRMQLAYVPIARRCAEERVEA